MIKIFEIITEIIGWILIALSPTLIGIVFGLIIYNYFQNLGGLIVGSFIAFIGLLMGIAWATNKFKTTGTMYFLSRIDASPDLDKLKKSEEKENISDK
jgi:hypothetical protein